MTARFSVRLIFSPLNIASRAGSRSHLPRQRQQQRLAVGVDQCGQVGKHMRCVQAEIFKALRVLRKGVPYIEVLATRIKVALERNPRRRSGRNVIFS